MSHALLKERLDRQSRERVRAGPWIRLRVFLGRSRFDRALTGGEDPDATPELSLRAEQLRKPKTRERLARGIDRLVEVAHSDPRRPLRPSTLALRDRRVSPHLDLLEELSGALRAPGPHSVRGLAMATTLLEEANGPLYASEPTDNLRDVLSETISEVRPDDDERSR